MTAQTAVPMLGEAFRELVTRGGLRKVLEERRLKKDLEDLAVERWPGSLCGKLENLESEVFTGIAQGAGHDWSELCKAHWQRAKAVIQFVAREINTSAMPADDGRLFFNASVTVLLVSEFLHEATSRIPGGPEVRALIDTPLKTWMNWRGVRSVDLTQAIDVDQKTTARWRRGKHVEKLSFPFASVMATKPENRENNSSTLAATGWLMVARALQSLEENFRASLQALNKHSPEDWPPIPTGIQHFNEQAMAFLMQFIPPPLIALDMKVYEAFSMRGAGQGLAKKRVAALDDAVAKYATQTREYWHPFIAGHQAKLAALRGEDGEAASKFRQAVDALWWKSGARGLDVVHSALVFSIGAGKKVDANHYWSMLSFLGLHREKFIPLDEQYIRMYSVLFEQEFQPRKVKADVFVGIDMDSTPFAVTRDMRRQPNSIPKKRPEGKLRLSPLMQAMLKGTLNDVQRLLLEIREDEKKGDVNNVVSGTGETALSCALRRAVDGKQPDSLGEIMAIANEASPERLPAFRAANAEPLYELLQLNGEAADETLPERLRVNAETANRPFGMSEILETPMKLAIDMADAKVVRRLIALGARIDMPCANTPNALMHAMSKYAHAVHPAMEVQSLQAHLRGEGAASGYDARLGAVLREQLGEARTRNFAAQAQSGQPERLWALWRAIFVYYSRPPEELLSVIEALLELGADPNFRFMKDGNHWSATLLAADIGSVPLMNLLLKYGGDINLSLDNLNLRLAGHKVTDKQDAHWIAHIRNHLPLKAFLANYAPEKRQAGDS